jgi:hypothetical protein
MTSHRRYSHKRERGAAQRGVEVKPEDIIDLIAWARNEAIVLRGLDDLRELAENLAALADALEEEHFRATSLEFGFGMSRN